MFIIVRSEYLYATDFPTERKSKGKNIDCVIIIEWEFHFYIIIFWYFWLSIHRNFSFECEHIKSRSLKKYVNIY